MASTFYQTTVYQIFLRAFTKEGTIRAAAEHLADIAALGAEYVYLCPVFTADDNGDQAFWSPRQKASGFNNPKNPYRIKDYFSVDPEYGTEKDLADFVRRAHELNMKVLFDLVYFHCGPDAVFLKEHPDFIRRKPDGTPDCGGWAFPRLNYDVPALREYLYENMLYWLKVCDIDGYRCDVGGCCPADFWQEGIRRCRRIKPDFFMIDESDPYPDTDAGFDAFYNFQWSDTLQKVLLEKEAPASLLAEEHQKELQAASYPALRLHTHDNHDYANDCFDTRYDQNPGTDGVNAALVFDALIDGIFFIYNGVEVCDTNRNSIFYSRAYSAGKDCTVAWDRRNLPCSVERLALLTRLIALRRELPALSGTATEMLYADDKAVAFARGTGENRIAVAVNFKAEPAVLPLDFSGRDVLLSHSSALDKQTQLGAYGYAVVTYNSYSK